MAISVYDCPGETAPKWTDIREGRLNDDLPGAVNEAFKTGVLAGPEHLLLDVQQATNGLMNSEVGLRRLCGCSAGLVDEGAVADMRDTIDEVVDAIDGSGDGRRDDDLAFRVDEADSAIPLEGEELRL